MNKLLNDKNDNKYGSIPSSQNINNRNRKSISRGRSPYFNYQHYSPALTARSTPIMGSSQVDSVDGNNDKITAWQAGFTVINLFLGLCLLSYPYALSQGSIISIIPFIFICFALCYTGKLIVRCFNTLQNDVEHSYPMVGYYSFGKFGFHLISLE